MLQWYRRYDGFPSTLASAWVRRNGSTNPLTASGVLTTNTTAGFYPAEFTGRPTRGPDQYSAVTVAALHPGTSGGTASCLFLRSPNNATSGTVAVLFITNRQIGIYTMNTWAAGSLTAQGGGYANVNGGSDMPAGSRIEFYVANGTFYGTYNGSTIVTWADTGATVSTTGRYGGAIMQYNSDASSINGCMGFDDFVFGDLRPVDVAMPMQSINRPTSF
ncbi:hypothetical protein [Nocardia sp. NBC_00511]|uniref:hypothetical protein n=1 Tax=Nocardia sp. NBC_00511 TaxID=2903591 RepID=UPI0030E258DD